MSNKLNKQQQNYLIARAYLDTLETELATLESDFVTQKNVVNFDGDVPCFLWQIDDETIFDSLRSDFFENLDVKTLEIVDKSDFLNALNAVGVKKDDYNKNVQLRFEFPCLRLLFQHPDAGTAQATIGFSGHEQPIELAFNIDYLTELLKMLPKGDIIYNFRDDINQGYFASQGVEIVDFRYILMPVKFASAN